VRSTEAKGTEPGASSTWPFDPDTGEIVASELTTTEDGDASQVGPLLDQISGPIASVTADGAYDGEPIYRTIAERDPAAAVIIPPRSTAVPSNTAETAPTQRDRHLQMIQARGRLGWQKTVNYGRARRLLSVEPDGLCRVPRLLPGPRGLREEA
jgi:hypothetical protein